jgi:hypothetical protein
LPESAVAELTDEQFDTFLRSELKSQVQAELTKIIREKDITEEARLERINQDRLKNYNNLQPVLNMLKKSPKPPPLTDEQKAFIKAMGGSTAKAGG